MRNSVDKLSKQKKSGLVFENHLPECTPLYDVPIKNGSKVALKTGKINGKIWNFFDHKNGNNWKFSSLIFGNNW